MTDNIATRFIVLDNVRVKKEWCMSIFSVEVCSSLC